MLLPGAVCIKTLAASATDSFDDWYIQRVGSTILSIQATSKFGLASLNGFYTENTDTGSYLIANGSFTWSEINDAAADSVVWEIRDHCATLLDYFVGRDSSKYTVGDDFVNNFPLPDDSSFIAGEWISQAGNDWILYTSVSVNAVESDFGAVVVDRQTAWAFFPPVLAEIVVLVVILCLRIILPKVHLKYYTKELDLIYRAQMQLNPNYHLFGANELQRYMRHCLASLQPILMSLYLGCALSYYSDHRYIILTVLMSIGILMSCILSRGITSNYMKTLLNHRVPVDYEREFCHASAVSISGNREYAGMAYSSLRYPLLLELVRDLMRLGYYENALSILESMAEDNNRKSWELFAPYLSLKCELLLLLNRKEPAVSALKELELLLCSVKPCPQTQKAYDILRQNCTRLRMKCEGSWSELLSFVTKQLANESNPERMIDYAFDQYRAATHLNQRDIALSASKRISQYALGMLDVLQQYSKTAAHNT